MAKSLQNLETYLVVISAAVCIRAIASLHSYSGKGKAPMFGDYEAQRHWQEITVNLKPEKWYINSTENNLLYWGLDYPPLTAYHSYLMGRLGEAFNRSYVELEKSKGIESEDHKHFMRSTVLVVDFFLYIPSMFYLGKTLQNTFKKTVALPFAMITLLYPGQILIDNGHFQYNNFSLALAALALALVLKDKHKSAAFCFSLSLNYKQMELYHALPFFAYLLKISFNQKSSVLTKFQKLFGIGGTVIVTFGLLWLPWLHSLGSMSSVLLRLFPFARGIFEDKVANFWCALNVVYKLKAKYSNSQMALICLWTTLATVLPINIKLFISPAKDRFIRSLILTAMSFYLFSFQVHEKSILLVALPSFCMLVFDPDLTIFFLEVTTLSMFPLFIKDRLTVAYFALLIVFHITYQEYIRNMLVLKKGRCMYLDLVFVLIIVLSVCALLVPVPDRYPDLWPLIICVFSFMGFTLYSLSVIYKELRL